jgi:hypothetical protein
LSQDVWQENSLKGVIAFITAVVATYILAVLMYTQLNLANLVEMGLALSFTDRVSAGVHDLGGMIALYLPIITVAFVIAFSFTRVVLKWVPQLRTLGYILAGFVGIYTVDYALGALLTSGTHPLPVTRTTVGLLSQCVAGAIGGYVFVRMLGQPQQDASVPL